jgi:7-cyano-7-deazaguanine synthase
MKDHSSVLLLASGGIDSTALIDFYRRRNTEVKAVHFQYGQPSAQSEMEAFEKVSKYYRVETRLSNQSFPMTQRGDELIGRNLFFTLAASTLETPPLRISLGIHQGTLYYDCTRTFVDDCQRLLDGYFGGTVRLETPFIDLRKADIIDYCKRNNVPLNLTYSCLRQNSPPCGTCSSCSDRKKFYRWPNV